MAAVIVFLFQLLVALALATACVLLVRFVFDQFF